MGTVKTSIMFKHRQKIQLHFGIWIQEKCEQKTLVLLLMQKILHQLIWIISHVSYRLCRIFSINSMFRKICQNSSSPGFLYFVTKPSGHCLVVASHWGDDTLPKMPVVPTPRRDFPKIESRTRGSMKRALGAAMPSCRMESIAALQEDFYANSSKPSQQSLYATWSKLAAACGLPPIPISSQLLLSIGASMKHAGYMKALSGV